LKVLKRSIGVFVISALVFLFYLFPPTKPPVSAAPLASTITIGVQQPPAYYYGAEINAFNSLTAKRHGVVLFYTDWSQDFNYYHFLQHQINISITQPAPVSMIAWQPQNSNASGCTYSTAVPWTAISSGACDTFITTYANQVKSYSSERYLIKFAHEMNGGGQPYSPINIGGPNPSGFVAAWQRVKTIFATQGVTNAEFVWAPIWQSYPNTAANDIHLYYPGDSYVDWIGPMGYNFYKSNPSIGEQPWMTFDQIFGPTLRDFACLYSKPQIVHEFGSVEGDTNSPQTKGQWIADAYLKAQNYPFLRTIIWYNDYNGGNPSDPADFRISTHTGSAYPPPPTNVNPLPSDTHAWTDAYRTAIASSTYTSTLPSLATAKPANALCANKVYLPLIIR